MAAVGRADAAMAVLDAAAPAGASPIADRDLAGADKARNPDSPLSPWEKVGVRDRSRKVTIESFRVYTEQSA